MAHNVTPILWHNFANHHFMTYILHSSWHTHVHNFMTYTLFTFSWQTFISHLWKIHNNKKSVHKHWKMENALGWQSDSNTCFFWICIMKVTFPLKMINEWMHVFENAWRTFVFYTHEDDLYVSTFSHTIPHLTLLYLVLSLFILIVTLLVSFNLQFSGNGETTLRLKSLFKNNIITTNNWYWCIWTMYKFKYTSLMVPNIHQCIVIIIDFCLSKEG